ncbi:hypothetical protein KKF05_05490 [Patescibacteria group bacterium]|nr:hypothetical protein [Patescibacteria group bacterium]MBU1028704.1 hypothetical protein [Patescibacteria group bacterium]MBU1915968.1 hypothetical protein [Patescibacteria group bacterium]
MNENKPRKNPEPPNGIELIMSDLEKTTEPTEIKATDLLEKPDLEEVEQAIDERAKKEETQQLAEELNELLDRAEKPKSR